MSKKFIIISSILLFIFSSVVCVAQSTNQTAGGTDTTVSLTNPLANAGATTPPTIPELIGRVINGALGVVGSIALVMFIYGGFTWMTAAGNSEQVTKGKNIIVWAAIGLVVIFASYSLVRFVIQDAILGTVATP